MLASMPEAPLRLPAGGPTITIDVGADFADLLRRSGGRYERHLTALLPRLLPEDGVALDVGANAGAITLSMAHLARHGQVVAFEAAPRNADRLAANVARAGMRNVRIERVACYDDPGELSLSYTDEHTGGARVAHHPDASDVRVTAVALDDWMAASGLTRLDLVKIDVEGSELRVLRGARETLERFRPTLIVECNPVALAQQDGVTWDAITATFEGLGYQPGWIAGRGAVIPLPDRVTLSRILNAMGIVDIIATGDGPPAGERGPQALLGRLRARGRVRRANRRRRPPRRRFVVEPALVIDVDPFPQEAGSAGRMSVPLTLANHGTGWLSSDFTTAPVLLTHRWITPDGAEHGDEPRTRLPRPMPPGGTCRLALDLDVPAASGEWTLVIRAVQEGFVWLDTFAPEATRRIPVSVVPAEQC